MDVPISFELFPPNTEQGLKNCRRQWRLLNKVKPEYFSVTFGACGANQDKSLTLIQALLADHIAVVPHLTCVGLTKQHISSLLGTYQQHSIKHVIALRGDMPADKQGTTGDFQHANELVAFIREVSGHYFHIDVAAYPEFHPQSDNCFYGLACFQQKIVAGANGAITQYFFNREAYSRFLESCCKLNINVPIVPGIMPITSFPKLVKFSESCGADIPKWLYKRLSSYGDDEESIRQYGIDVVSRLCEGLIADGAPGLHFYTLNQAEPTLAILSQLSSHLAQTAADALMA